MEKTVNLDLGTILRECSLNRDLELEHFYFFSLANRENIHTIFKYKKFNDDFTDCLACYNDRNHIIGYIRPSYDEFLSKLLAILNIDAPKNLVDDDKLTKLMLERIEALKKIRTESDLKSEFPILYADLIKGRKYYNGLQILRRQEGYSEEEYASGEHYYYSCALKKSLTNFVKTQAVMYTRYAEDRHKLKELQEKKSYNSYLKKHFDMSKLYMYVIHEYLSFCEGSSDIKMIEDYLLLIKNYLTSSIDKTVTINTKEGIVVNIDMIKQRYENLEKLVKDKSSQVEWVLVPEGESLTKGSVTQSEKPRKIKLSKEKIRVLKNIGQRKRMFYATHPYLARAVGLRKYHGYVAYIYENGEIILDREYNENYPRTAVGNAIYNLKVEDFETLSRENKTVLMRHPKVGRIIHTADWEKRVHKIVSRPATDEEKEETKKLVKRLQKGESKI